MVQKKYWHIGVAVDTDRGLLVPVIRDVDRKSVHDLAAELAALAEKARQRKLSIDEMRGGAVEAVWNQVFARGQHLRFAAGEAQGVKDFRGQRHAENLAPDGRG